MSEETPTEDFYITLSITDELVFDTNLASVEQVIFWMRKFEQRILESFDSE